MYQKDDRPQQESARDTAAENMREELRRVKEQERFGPGTAKREMIERWVKLAEQVIAESQKDDAEYLDIVFAVSLATTVYHLLSAIVSAAWWVEHNGVSPCYYQESEAQEWDRPQQESWRDTAAEGMRWELKRVRRQESCRPGTGRRKMIERWVKLAEQAVAESRKDDAEYLDIVFTVSLATTTFHLLSTIY